MGARACIRSFVSFVSSVRTDRGLGGCSPALASMAPPRSHSVAPHTFRESPIARNVAGGAAEFQQTPPASYFFSRSAADLAASAAASDSRLSFAARFGQSRPKCPTSPHS